MLVVSLTISTMAIALLVATWVVKANHDTSSTSDTDDTITAQQLLNLEAGSKVTVTGTVKKGQPAPAASFPYLDGTAGSISDFAGKPLIVNFWATTCVPCRQEMPAIEALHAEYGDRLAVLGIDVAESVEKGRAFADEMKVTYRLGRDPQSKLIGAFGGIGLPHTVAIDADGTVVAVRNKPLDAAGLRELAGLALG
jgi:thiol-disulfide isomerase/thioredoxin